MGPIKLMGIVKGSLDSVATITMVNTQKETRAERHIKHGNTDAHTRQNSAEITHRNFQQQKWNRRPALFNDSPHSVTLLSSTVVLLAHLLCC